MNNQITTSICDLNGNKACAVTFTTDDALYKSCLFYNSRFKKYGLKGTAVITLDMVAEENAKRMPGDESGTWDQWRDIVDQGCFDIANHTKSHTNLDKLSPDELEIEINKTRKILLSNFPGQKVLCMANPYVVTNDMIDDIIRQQHYSARNGEGGFNTVDPSDNEWYRLNFKVALHDTSAEDMNAWVDKAVLNHNWLIELWHGIDGQGWEPPTSAVCDSHLSYLAMNLSSVWNGTMNEVTQYIREKQNANIETTFTNNGRIMIILNVNLDTSLFTYPLTLKTTLPEGWTGARIIQGNHIESAFAQHEGNTVYVVYDAVPNAGKIMLTEY